MRPADLLEAKTEWVDFLRETSVQIRKFGENHRRVKIDRLHHAVRPLLKRWPDEWAQAHPILAEMDRRFGLTVFWQAVEEVQNDSNDGAAAQFSSRQKDLNQSLIQLKSTWNRFISTSDEQKKIALASFLRSLLQFLPKKAWFPGNLADPLFDGLKSTGDKLAERLKAKSQGPVDSSLAFEVAATISLIEELVERNARWNHELEVRIGARAHRLGLALDGRGQELRSLAPLRWDSKWKERQTALAIQTAMGIVARHCEIINKALTDVSKEEDVEEVRGRLEELKGRSNLIGNVLLTLRQPLAAKIALGLAPRIEGAVLNQNASENMAVLAKAIASLSSFLMATRNGDVDMEAVLSSGYDAMFGVGAFQKIQEEGASFEVIDAPVGVPAVVPPVVSPIATEEAPAPIETLVVPKEPSVPVVSLKDALLGDGAVDTIRDPGILEVFLEEAGEALGEVEQQRQVLAESPLEMEAWSTLKRQFHTLKGSGKISGLMALGEVANWMEDRLSDAILSSEAYSDRLDSVVALTAGQLGQWYDELRQGATEVHVQGAEIYEAVKNSWPEEAHGLREDEDLGRAEEEFAWPGDENESGRDDTQNPLSEEDQERQQMDELVRTDAQEHADVLATALARMEEGGGWDLEAIYLSAHTLASLAPDGDWQAMRELGKAVERASETSTLAAQVPEALWADAQNLLRDMGTSLAAGLSCPDAEKEVARRMEEAMALDGAGPDLSGAPDAEVAEEVEGEVPEQTLETPDLSDDLTGSEMEATEGDLRDPDLGTPVSDEWDSIVPDMGVDEPAPAVTPTELTEGEPVPFEESQGLPPQDSDTVVQESGMDAADGSDGFEEAEEGVDEDPAPVIDDLVESVDLNVEPGDFSKVQELVSSMVPPPPVGAETDVERELAWDRIFDTLDAFQASFNNFANAIIALRELDERE